MKNRDLLSSLLCIVIGALFSMGAFKYGLGRVFKPGPGLYPLIISTVFISLSLVHLLSTLRKPQEKSPPFFPQEDSWRKSLLSLVALFGYGFFIETLGYVCTTLLFMGFVLKFVGLQKWKTVFTAALLSTVCSYLLFVTLLKSPLPTGPFRIF